MRKAAIVVALGFVVTLAAIIGMRMSAEALAVVVDVVCGVAAGIPVSLLLLAATRRHQRQAEDDYEPHGQRAMRSGAYPPVVVIQGGTQAPSWSGAYGANQLQSPFYGTAVEASPRKFRVVGEERWEVQ